MSSRLAQRDFEQFEIKADSEKVSVHRLPVHVFAKDQTSVPDRTRSLIWPFYCEWRGELLMLKQVVKSMPSLCCDYGVEHIIPRMLPFPLRTCFPWTDLDVQIPHPVDAFADIDEVVVRDAGVDELQVGPCVTMDHMLPAIGLIHEMHNLSNDLGNAMKHYKPNIRRLKHVAKLVREPESRKHLKATCFDTVEGKMRAVPFDYLSGRVVKDRWATIADCAMQAEEIEPSLRWGWLKDRYEGSSCPQQPNADDSDDDFTNRALNIDLVDHVVHNEYFCGWLDMFRFIAIDSARL